MKKKMGWIWEGPDFLTPLTGLPTVWDWLPRAGALG